MEATKEKYLTTCKCFSCTQVKDKICDKEIEIQIQAYNDLVKKTNSDTIIVREPNRINKGNTYDGMIGYMDERKKERVNSTTIPTHLHDVLSKAGVNINYASNISTNNKFDNITLRSYTRGIIGMDNVKLELEKIVNFQKTNIKRSEAGLSQINISNHFIFKGAAGTGKTTIARVVAEIFKDLNYLKKGHIVETDASGLIASYVGQTSEKTLKVLKSALGGVLFIDEAYGILNASSYGDECISTILKFMEDNRDDIIVIAAGYSDDMERFMDSNSGIRSRFSNILHFENYTLDELSIMLKDSLEKDNFIVSNEFLLKSIGIIEKAMLEKSVSFGNARYIRNLKEATVKSQFSRVANISNATVTDLRTILECDLD